MADRRVAPEAVHSGPARGQHAAGIRVSGWGDDDLAEGAALTDLGEPFRYLIERAGAVDVDAHVTGDAQIGQRLEVGWTRLHDQHPEAAARDHPRGRADRE